MKALPFLTVDEYLWGYSSSFIRLMAADQSRVRYLSQKQIEKRKAERERERNGVFTAGDVIKELGLTGTQKGQAVAGDWKQAIYAQQEEERQRRLQQEQNQQRQKQQ